MNHVMEKQMAGIICVKMKLYLKEKIFKDLLQGKQHSTH